MSSRSSPVGVRWDEKPDCTVPTHPGYIAAHGTFRVPDNIARVFRRSVGIKIAKLRRSVRHQLVLRRFPCFSRPALFTPQVGPMKLIRPLVKHREAEVGDAVVPSRSLDRGAMLFGAERRRRLAQDGRAAARLLDLGGRHRGERRLRAWCRAGVARGRHVRAPGQPVQAAAVRQGQWSSGEERSTRCPHDRVVHRHHADTSGAA